MKSIFSALLGLILAASPALATSPIVGGMKPLGAQRGTEVVVSINGQRLGDAEEILFYQPGITVTKIDPVSEGEIKATLKIAADARLGLYDLRVRTGSGISRLRTFSVGGLKEINEVEPNNDFAVPQAIEMNSTVNGIADNEDVDYFAVRAKKGERISAEVEGIRLGEFLFDPFVAIQDAKRFELKSSDDAALIWQDGFASVVAPEDGMYIVQVRESAYAGNGNCHYRLHIGNYPRPTATVPAGGKLGEPVILRWIGDALGETTTTLTLPAAPTRNFGVVAHDDKGTAPYSNAFRLSPFGNVIETEPNNNQGTATPCVPPVALNGIIEKAGDVDFFTFKCTKGQTYDVRVFARQLRSPLDPVLYVGARSGGALIGNDDAPGPDSAFRFSAPNDGEYVIWLNDHLNKGGPDYFYRVEISPVEPKLTLSPPNEALPRGAPIMAVSVPSGNRQAILINAGRTDFGGDLILTAANLPAGVTFEADTMSASTATIPVLFSAAPATKTIGTLASISGKMVDPKVTVTSEFSATVELTLGQNNVPFWVRTVDTLPITVADEAPFSIEVVEPKVPIVRGGSMELKVVAKRAPGFTAPIYVSLPWNPPGIASKGDVSIPEKQDSATISINADGGAELKTWKIVVNGTYNEPPAPPTLPPGSKKGRGSGQVMVSSQLAKLTVASQFVTLDFNAATVEQGKEVDLAVKVNKAVDFPGEAKVTLIGLPNKVTTDTKTITKDSGDVVFHVKTDPTSPAGETKNLFCQVVITKDGEPIVHNLGTGRLRIDTPLPPKPNAPAPAPAAPKPAAPAPPPAAVPAKPLSRLEKLRQESQERAKAAAQAPK